MYRIRFHNCHQIYQCYILNWRGQSVDHRPGLVCYETSSFGHKIVEKSRCIKKRAKNLVTFTGQTWYYLEELVMLSLKVSRMLEVDSCNHWKMVGNPRQPQVMCKSSRRRRLAKLRWAGDDRFNGWAFSLAGTCSRWRSPTVAKGEVGGNEKERERRRKRKEREKKKRMEKVRLGSN